MQQISRLWRQMWIGIVVNIALYGFLVYSVLTGSYKIALLVLLAEAGLNAIIRVLAETREKLNDIRSANDARDFVENTLKPVFKRTAKNMN